MIQTVNEAAALEKRKFFQQKSSKIAAFFELNIFWAKTTFFNSSVVLPDLN